MDFQRDYLWDDMASYMTSLFDWISDEAESLNIERWFLFVTSTDLEQQARADGYAGIYLFEHGGKNAPMNRLGQLYREYAIGLR